MEEQRHSPPPKNPTASDSFYTPLLISMVGILSTSIAVLVYHFVLVKLCLRRNSRAFATTNPTDVEAAHTSPHDPQASRGVDQKLLETIPVIAYRSTTRSEGMFRADQTECVVCLGDLEHGEMVRLLPYCKHAFHVACIDEWFAAHTNCPICRSPVAATEEDMEQPSSRGVNGVVPASPSPSSSPLPNADVVELACENPNDIATAPSSSPSRVKSLSQPFAVLPPPLWTSGLAGELRRSLSLDQSSIIIDIQQHQQRASGRDCSSSSSFYSSKDDLIDSRTAGSRSKKHLDRVSSKLLSSFSRLRLGKNSEILPF